MEAVLRGNEKGEEEMRKIEDRLDWILFRLGEIQDSQRIIMERMQEHSLKPKNHRLER